MGKLSVAAKVYIIGAILIGCGLIAWTALELNWGSGGLYVLAVLGAAAQTLKVEGPNNRTNYRIAWFAYGFAFILFGPVSAIFVVVVSHLAEWIWHKYPWYIQAFNIGAHVISVAIAGLAFETAIQGTQGFDPQGAVGMVAANLTFVLANHILVGMVVKLARGQSFSESGVFGSLTLFLDFSVLSMGMITALVWRFNPFASLLNILPLYLLYNALRVPALKRQLQEMHKVNAQVRAGETGD